MESLQLYSQFSRILIFFPKMSNSVLFKEFDIPEQGNPAFFSKLSINLVKFHYILSDFTFSGLISSESELNSKLHLLH